MSNQNDPTQGGALPSVPLQPIVGPLCCFCFGTQQYRAGFNPIRSVKVKCRYCGQGEVDIQCEGSCEEHKGEVAPVLCYAPGDREPWRFNYCEEAIAEDERRGFTVIRANPSFQGGGTL